jgi:hypothetical protein
MNDGGTVLKKNTTVVIAKWSAAKIEQLTSKIYQKKKLKNFESMNEQFRKDMFSSQAILENYRNFEKRSTTVYRLIVIVNSLLLTDKTVTAIDEFRTEPEVSA